MLHSMPARRLLRRTIQGIFQHDLTRGSMPDKLWATAILCTGWRSGQSQGTTIQHRRYLLRSAPHSRLIRAIAFRSMLAALLLSPVSSSAQHGGGELPTFTNVGPAGTMTTGPDYMVLADYAQMTLDQQNREMKRNEQEQEKRKALVNSGLVSALDLEAPNSSIAQYNRAVALMKEQKSKEATQYLQKAIAHYPRFVAAHISLGLAYLDQDDTQHARMEFETAAQLDDKSSGSFLNLGRLSF